MKRKLPPKTRRKTSWLQTTALPVVVCFVLSGCVVSTLHPFKSAKTPPLATPAEPARADPAVADKAAPVVLLPPRFVRPGGAEICPEALQGLFKNYGYIIVDGDPLNPAQRDLQITLLGKARAAFKEGEQQGLRHRSFPVREPALALEIFSVESNAAFRETDGLAALDLASLEGGEDWQIQRQVADMYRPLLEAAETGGNRLPLRGLSLPGRVGRQVRSGGPEQVSPEDRRFLPPVILPMPEDEERLSGAAMVPPASGSSETAVLREPARGRAGLNLHNSALAWNAAQIAHEDVARPLFIVLGRAGFDQGEGLGEALAYFDNGSRVLQIIVVDGSPEKIKTDDGRDVKALVPVSPLPPVGRHGKADADYIFALVQPGSGR